MSRRGATVLILTVLVLSAGCQAPGTEAQQPTPSSTTTAPEPGLELRYNPPYNATRVLDRVEAIRGLNATGPIVIEEFPRQPRRSVPIPPRFLGIDRAGAVALGLATNTTISTGLQLGLTVQIGGVVQIRLMSRAGLSALNMSQELVLAHELTHALQYQHGLIGNNRAVLRSKFTEWTTDTRLVARAVIEGDAMSTMLTYRNLYAPDAAYTPFTELNFSDNNWQATLSTAPYEAGLHYFRTVGTSPSAKQAAFADPPNSTRLVLDPDAAPGVGSLPEPPSAVGEFRRTQTDSIGPLAIRELLSVNELSGTRAERVVAGWVDGRMSYYFDEGRWVVQWQTQWETTREAAMFVRAYRDQFDTRSPYRVDGLFVVPGTNTTPQTVADIDCEGRVVQIIAGESIDIVKSFRAESTTDSNTTAKRTLRNNEAVELHRHQHAPGSLL